MHFDRIFDLTDINLAIDVSLSDESVLDGTQLTTTDGTLVVLANFLLETKEKGIPMEETNFPAWMTEHREIRAILSRKTLD